MNKYILRSFMKNFVYICLLLRMSTARITDLEAMLCANGPFAFIASCWMCVCIRSIWTNVATSSLFGWFCVSQSAQPRHRRCSCRWTWWSWRGWRWLTRYSLYIANDIFSSFSMWHTFTFGNEWTYKCFANFDKEKPPTSLFISMFPVRIICQKYDQRIASRNIKHIFEKGQWPS